MSERQWQRLQQSEVMDYCAELRARAVLEHNEGDHAYRTFLETFTKDGEAASRPHGTSIGRRRS
jgi:hypothetical protein